MCAVPWDSHRHPIPVDKPVNFYSFQNNFASLKGPKWVLFRLKRFLLEAHFGGVGDENAESCGVVRPLPIPLVTRPVRHT